MKKALVTGMLMVLIATLAPPAHAAQGNFSGLLTLSGPVWYPGMPGSVPADRTMSSWAAGYVCVDGNGVACTITGVSGNVKVSNVVGQAGGPFCGLSGGDFNASFNGTSVTAQYENTGILTFFVGGSVVGVGAASPDTVGGHTCVFGASVFRVSGTITI